MDPKPLALTLLVHALLAPAAGPADAADVIASGARLASTCTGCHGTGGVTSGGALPSLAGQSKESLLTSLKAFKAGERSATVMTQLTKGYTDEQLDQLAAYFAAQQGSSSALEASGAGS